MSVEALVLITRAAVSDLERAAGSGGRVYVVDVADSVRSYPARFAFTSSGYHSQATRFERAEAEELVRSRTWSDARIVPLPG